MIKDIGNIITFRKGSFERNSLIMSSGATFRVFVGLLLYPVITRIYTKEDFGELSVYLAITSLIALAGTGLYPTALVIPKYRREFLSLLKLSLYLTMGSALLTLIISLVVAEYVTEIFKIKALTALEFYVPLGVLLLCLQQIILNWAVRKKAFTRHMVSTSFSALGNRLISIFLAWAASASSLVLVASQLAAYTISVGVFLQKQLIKDLYSTKLIPLKQIKITARTYKNYPRLLLPANLVNKFSADLPIYALTAFFSPTITGAYFLANNILSIPVDVVGTSVANVFLQRANELHQPDKAQLSAFTIQTHRRLLTIGCLSYGIIFAFGDILFSWVFGDEWLFSGQIAIILSAYFVFKLISGPLARVYRVVAKEIYSLNASVILAVLRTLGIVFGLFSGSPMTAILYFSLANLAGYLINTALVFKAVNAPWYKLCVETVLITSATFTVILLMRLFLIPELPHPLWN